MRANSLKAMVIAPSSPGSDLAASAKDRACYQLASIGIAVEFAPNCFAACEDLAVAPALRLADIRTALARDDIDLVFTLYGGYNCIDLLPGLPYDMWASTRKPLIGFSDITALQMALWHKIGLHSFHGPNFASLGAPEEDRYALDGLVRCLSEPSATICDPGRITLDLWYGSEAKSQRDWKENSWHWNGSKPACGPLLGGNISTLAALAGTDFFPSFEGAILLIESDIDEPVRLTDRCLAQLKLAGAFTQLAGIIVGARGETDDGLMLRMLEKHVPDFAGPVVSKVNLSHVDPIATIPIGAKATVDPVNRSISYVIGE
jgi:muramoyltetrapeptide carboxypeptidase